MTNKIPAYASIVFLIIGIIGGVPYDFYILLRWVVFGSSIYYGYSLMSSNNNSTLGIFLFFSAFLFNPIAPLNLGRGLWVVVDIFALVLFVFLLKTEKEKK